MKIQKKEFMGWKNCYSITNNNTEMIVTTDVGPRIISFSHNGKPNHMAVFADQAGTSGQDKFTPFGGHRVWHAPEESIRTYFPDNSLCEVHMENNYITILSQERPTGLKKGVSISVDEDGAFVVDNIIINEGHFDVELSIWGLTQFALGGLLAVPESTLDTGLVANRAISLWPYSKLNDRRVYFGEKYITVSPDTLDTPAFKFGTTCDAQAAYYFNHNQLIAKKFEYYFEADYPNYSCNFESYTNKDFIEIESLSPLFTLESGETAVHTEKWYVFDNISKPGRNDEAAIEKAIKSLKI